ncbi:3-hydroxyacyl-CoA dehydrogenase [Saccharopolyspora taberi]|uniref:3-hydroxyacyl-CoA dehydrogenase n=1 Tax=Saccharopolyspora taberi TaxID=60895 RepID=A0ABN3V354_9PSEU
MGQWARQVGTVRVIGTGVMGRGIAQLAAAAGLTVELADARAEAVAAAVDHVGQMFGKLAAKGRMTAEQAEAATARLRPVGDPLAPAENCDLVVEAVREDLETKRELFAALEKVCPERTVLATNTSSLSVTAIAAALEDPSRFAGLHFFNPVPLMRLVEVIPGARSRPALTGDLVDLVRRFGHEPVIAADTPGFLVNHAGRGLVTEALQIMAESGVAPSDVDRIGRDVLGLRMGPFELLDLTGLDVSHPVLESVWSGFYGDPRLRPSGITRSRLEAGLLGRKTGEGFYRYVDGVKQEAPEAPVPDAPLLPVWVDDSEPESRERLIALLADAGVEIAEKPSDDTIAFVASCGRSAARTALGNGLRPERTFGVEPLNDFGNRMVMAVHIGADRELADSAHAVLAATGLPVTVVADAPATIAQRLLASIVNTACGIAEQRIGVPADIDTAVRLALGYPRGPLEWGEHVGAERILRILRSMQAETGDPRYRPSRWLTERVELGIPLTETGTAP